MLRAMGGPGLKNLGSCHLYLQQAFSTENHQGMKIKVFFMKNTKTICKKGFNCNELWPNLVASNAN